MYFFNLEGHTKITSKNVLESLSDDFLLGCLRNPWIVPCQSTSYHMALVDEEGNFVQVRHLNKVSYIIQILTINMLFRKS